MTTNALGDATAAALETHYAAGANAVRVRFPTGYGKNLVLASLVAAQSKQGPCLVVVPVALKQQFHEELKRVDPDLKVGDWGSDFPVELVSPLTAAGRSAMRSPDAFPLVVIDECHAANAPSIRKVTEHFTGARILEVIAMPHPHPGLVEADADVDFAALGLPHPAKASITDETDA